MIENDGAGLSWRRSQGAACHLQVQTETLRRPHQDCCANGGNVETFGNESAVTEDLELAGTERRDQALALRRGRLAVNVCRRDARGIEAGRDLLAMFNVDGESDCRNALAEPLIMFDRIADQRAGRHD